MDYNDYDDDVWLGLSQCLRAAHTGLVDFNCCHETEHNPKCKLCPRVGEPYAACRTPWGHGAPFPLTDTPLTGLACALQLSQWNLILDEMPRAPVTCSEVHGFWGTKFQSQSYKYRRSRKSVLIIILRQTICVISILDTLTNVTHYSFVIKINSILNRNNYKYMFFTFTSDKTNK